MLSCLRLCSEEVAVAVENIPATLVLDALRQATAHLHLLVLVCAPPLTKVQSIRGSFVRCLLRRWHGGRVIVAIRNRLSRPQCFDTMNRFGFTDFAVHSNSRIPCDFLPEGVILFTFPVIPVGFRFKREDCP